LVMGKSPWGSSGYEELLGEPCIEAADHSLGRESRERA
jgi:hypothetical protein